MRIILTINLILLAFSVDLSGQNNFMRLDKQTYDYYLRGDYKNLKKTADTLLLQGIDYYYLRVRLGILAFNRQLYSTASEHFSQAIKFSSLDTISREYIFYSYLYSGREADAYLYMNSISPGQKNNTLKLLPKPGLSNIYVGSSVTGYDVFLYKSNNLYYESVKNSLSISAGFEGYFLNRFKGTIVYTNYRKSGTYYSASNTAGADLNFSQNQIYAKLTGYIFPGWEFSGFGHIAFYPDFLATIPAGNQNSATQRVTEYALGAGISKNGYKIRTGANFSLSNFGNSTQRRGEGFFTWLPSGNLNLYLTSGGMYQSDKYWGGTYQLIQEIGFKISRSLWFESGIVNGNSFLYCRNQGLMFSNSFQIPVTTIFSNIIIIPGKHFSLTITPFYTENRLYSWDLIAYTRANKLGINSFGGMIKLNYKFR
jgi:hypothetical protein